MKSISDNFSQQLDPIQSDAYIFISEQIFDGLVRLDKKLNIVPELADYWTISDDGKVYTFYLRKGIPFHNHREMLASDVKFSLERIIAKENNSPYFHYFLNRVKGAVEFRKGRDTEVRGFKVLDKHVFQIEWTKPYVSSLYLLSMPFCKVLPADLVKKQGYNFFYKPIGTGPFYFDSWIRDTRLNIAGVRLKRNDEYFLGAPYLDFIEFCPFFTLEHFLNEAIDLIPVVSEKLLDEDFKIYVDGSINTYFLGMSCHIPPFDRKEVRRAVLFGIDKQQLIEAVAEPRYVRTPVNNFIPSRLPGFYPTNDDVVFNFDRAVSLLWEVGLMGENKFPEVILFMRWPRTDFSFNFQRDLKKQLSLLGINLKTRYYRSIEEVQKCREPFLILWNELMTIPDPADLIQPLFQSNSIFNIFCYSNEELDEILQKTEIERSWSKRIHFFHQIEQLLQKEIPAIPLFSQQNRIAIQPYIKGVRVPPFGFYYLDARKIWKEDKR